MEVVNVLGRQVIIMFILMMVGYVAYKKKLITDQGSKDIGKLLLNVAIPVVVISNFWVEKSAERTAELLQSLLISFVAMVLSIVVGYLLFHKSDRIGEFSAAFSNAGFIGIPLVQATFGTSAVFYISMMIVLINFLQWTYGVYAITDDKSVMDLKKVMKNPLIIAVIIGICVYMINIPMPSIVNSVFSLISGFNTPMAMIVSGVYLAQSDLLAMIRNKQVYVVSLVRLVIIPVIIMFVFKLLPLGSETLKLSILLAAACPVGSNVAVFAQQYDKDYRSGVQYVCVSTLLCLISLPLVIYRATVLF